MTKKSETEDIADVYTEFLVTLEIEQGAPQELTLSLLAELVDATRQHGQHLTYIKGCRGPLCKKSHRDTIQKLRNRSAVSQKRFYKPRADRRWDALLEEVQSFHSNYWKATHAA